MPPQPTTGAPAPAPKTDLLDESNGKERASKFLVLGARRDGGQMAPIAWYDDAGKAAVAADVLVTTGFKTVEVYTRVSVHEK